MESSNYLFLKFLFLLFCHPVVYFDHQWITVPMKDQSRFVLLSPQVMFFISRQLKFLITNCQINWTGLIIQEK